MMDSNRVSYSARTLRRILTVAKTMDIEEAAFELYERVMTTSMSVSHLENWLGLKLFIRDGNKIAAITAAGKAYLDYAETVLNAQEMFDDRMRKLRSGIPEEAMKMKLSGTLCLRCPNCSAPTSILAEKCDYCDSNLSPY